MEGQLGTWKYGYSVSPRGSDFWVARDSIRVFLLLNEERPFRRTSFESSTISRVDGDLVVTSWFSKLGKKNMSSWIPCCKQFKNPVFPYGCSNPCSNLPIKNHHLPQLFFRRYQLTIFKPQKGPLEAAMYVGRTQKSGSSDLLGQKRHARKPRQFYSDRVATFPGRGMPPYMVVIFRIWESETPKWPKHSLQKECNKGNRVSSPELSSFLKMNSFVWWKRVSPSPEEHFCESEIWDRM